jgi:hypothetical protein
MKTAYSIGIAIKATKNIRGEGKNIYAKKPHKKGRKLNIARLKVSQCLYVIVKM